MRLALLLLTFVCFLFGDAIAQKMPGLIPYRKGDKWGYADSTKKIIIEPKYKSADFFSDGVAKVGLDTCMALIDEKENILFRFKNLDVGRFSNGLARVQKCDIDYCSGKVGYINKSGKLIIGYKYEAETSDMFRNSYAIVSKPRSGFGMIDTLGVVAIPLKNWYVYWLNDSCVIAETRKKTYAINVKTKKKIKLGRHWFLDKKEIIDNLVKGGFVLDSVHGRFLMEGRYSYYNIKTYLPLQHDGKNYYTNDLCDTVNKINYSDAIIYKQGYIKVSQNGSWGIIDFEGKILVDFKYAEMHAWESCLFYVKNNGLFGYVDIYGTEYWND